MVPQTLKAIFTSVQIMNSRTSRRFLQSRITPDMEKKLVFLTSQVTQLPELYGTVPTVGSVVDPKLCCSVPDSDHTFQEISDPDRDPDPNPT